MSKDVNVLNEQTFMFEMNPEFWEMILEILDLYREELYEEHQMEEEKRIQEVLDLFRNKLGSPTVDGKHAGFWLEGNVYHGRFRAEFNLIEKKER